MSYTILWTIKLSLFKKNIIFKNPPVSRKPKKYDFLSKEIFQAWTKIANTTFWASWNFNFLFFYIRLKFKITQTFLRWRRVIWRQVSHLPFCCFFFLLCCLMLFNGSKISSSSITIPLPVVDGAGCSFLSVLLWLYSWGLYSCV